MAVALDLRAAASGTVANGDQTIAPGIGGSEVAASTSVANTALGLDPNQSSASTTGTVAATSSTTSSDDSSSSSSLISSSSASPSASSSNGSISSKTTTIIIATVAAAGFLIITVAVLVLFCRPSRRAKRRQSRRGHWREIESQHSQGGPGLPPGLDLPKPSDGMFESKSLYSTRRSAEAPPSLHLNFPSEPLMTANPFAASPASPVPPIPSVPQLRHAQVQQVQQPQQPFIEHPVDPPSAGFSAPSEYTASYIRSMYSTAGDTHSIDSHGTGYTQTPRSRSNTLKRAADRSKNQHELIALDNLIAALDLDPQAQAQRSDLPDPALFRAALGGGGAAPHHS